MPTKRRSECREFCQVNPVTFLGREAEEYPEFCLLSKADDFVSSVGLSLDAFFKHLKPCNPESKISFLSDSLSKVNLSTVNLLESLFEILELRMTRI